MFDNITLNSQQQEIYDLVVNNKESVFITGIAGVGKTALCHSIYQGIKKQGYEVISVSFTGKAASNMPGGGTTVSRSVGMKLGSTHYLPEGYRDKSPYRNYMRPSITEISKTSVDRRWESERLLVFVDEAGQLSTQNARLFYDIAMRVRGDKLKPIWVFTADFGQLSPIEGECILEPATFLYTSDQEGKIETLELPSIVKDINPKFVELTEVVRQNDLLYLRALRWLYHGIALHPVIKNRLNFKAPLGTRRIMFNNDEVVAENQLYVERYLAENPNASYSVYKADYDKHKITKTMLKDLVPVLPEQKIAVGMIFNVTENVPDPSDMRSLLVANGEAVIVEQLHSKFIVVRKSNGSQVRLCRVQHSLPEDKQGKKPHFMQLPGYVGHSITIYRVQGMTFKEPIEYGAWQWMRSNRLSLKNQPGSLYVMLSRNTELDQVYFDTSFGKDKALSLLKSAVTTNQNVRKYVMQDKPPLWITDPLAESIVIELERVKKEDHLSKGAWIFFFRQTLLDNGSETCYYLRCIETEVGLRPLFLFNAPNAGATPTFIAKPKELSIYSALVELAKIWESNYFCEI